jgi:hypothetical protein
VSEVGLDWTLNLILIVKSPQYGNLSDDGRSVDKMDANQAKTDKNLKDMKEEIKSGQAEKKSTVSAIEEKMEAAKYSMRAWRKEMMACQGTTEAYLECTEPTSEGRQLLFFSTENKTKRRTQQEGIHKCALGKPYINS